MDFLKKLEEELTGVIDSIKKQINDSTDEDEVRSLSAQLKANEGKLAEVRSEIAKATETRSFDPMATYSAATVVKEVDEDPTNSMEYRKAFMSYVTRNVAIPTELRDVTKTTDVSSVIPTVLVEKLIEKMEASGMILPLVTKTNIAAGIVVPTSTVKPVATWVAEGAGSAKQKGSTGKISFTYNKLRCEVAVSMEVGTMALAVFEAKFIENVSKAMVKAIEQTILNGDGSGKPKGILTEVAPSGQAITLKGATPTYAELVDAESALPVEYEATAKWCMTKKAFGSFIGMVDANKQPIARMNYGLNGKIERVLLGREVVIHPYADNMAGFLAFMYDFSDYAFNTIYDMGIAKEQDWDTEDLKTKAVMSVDGKPLSVDSLVTVKAAG